MKDYGRLLGTPEAAAFSARVRDFSEWVVEQPHSPRAVTGTTLVVQDPCHLRHVQRAHGAVRTALGPAYTAHGDRRRRACAAVPGERTHCCSRSSPRTFAIAKPARCAGPSPGDQAVVASANPGCMLHLRQAGLDVRHPADLLAAALEEEQPADGR